MSNYVDNINDVLEKGVKRTYKDSVFRLYFNDKARLRHLYNALKGENYGEDVPIDIVTLENAIFIDRKDDIAFTIGNRFVVLIEHQSTVNCNMPVRMLVYLGRVYERMLNSRDYYRRRAKKLPVPEIYVLYNGNEDIPVESELKLSDSYSIEEKDKLPINTVELVVKVLNVKYNEGTELLKRSRELEEYSILIHYVELNLKGGMGREEAVKSAVEKCIKEGIMEKFLREHGTEVCGMLFEHISYEEYAEIRAEEQYEQGRSEGIELGRSEGIEKGIELGRSEGIEKGIELGRSEGIEFGESKGIEKTAREMKLNGIDINLIIKCTGLTREQIEKL